MIRIRGKERSGTTWLEMLLRYNFHCGKLDTHMKHYFTGDMGCSAEMTIVISKHPLDWFYSYSKYLGKDISEGPLELIDSWNVFHAAWLAHAEEDIVKFIRYEDLLGDPEGVLTGICVERNHFAFDRIDTVVTPDKKILDEEFCRGMEGRIEAYKMNPEVAASLREAVDYGIMKRLGYYDLNL